LAGPPDGLRKLAPYIDIGAVMAGCVVAGVLLGRYLDGKLDSEPWMLLFGSLLGVGAGFYHFFKVVLRRPAQSSGAEKRDDDRTET
jgi:F0F1-type ATP synthase assembly protein I